MTKYTDEQLAAARNLAHRYDSYVQMLWDNYVFELARVAGIDEDEASELLSGAM